MARFVLKDIEPLEIETTDGKVYKALFNTEAAIIFTELFGDVTEVDFVDKPYEFVAKALYSGMKVFDPTVTLELAESIVVKGGGALASSVLEMWVANFLEESSEDVKKKFWQEMQETFPEADLPSQ